MAGIMGASDNSLLGKAFGFMHHNDSYRISHALEDLPADARAEVAEITSLPSGLSLRRKIFDELENAGLDSYGNLERIPLLHFLCDYPVIRYTYDVSPVMALATYHLPIADMNPPKLAQVVALLDLLTGPDSLRTYVHCEAGKGRTGVMTACYRMAVMGWSAIDALIEAKNFGCSVPMQQAFIQAFGAMLQVGSRAGGGQESSSALGAYPLKPLGSVKARTAELTATVASIARLEKGER
jgi:hypothetical protein